MNEQSIEYRLSYWQTLVNPASGILGLAAALFAGLLGIWLIGSCVQISSPLSLLGMLMFGVSLTLLVYRSPKRRTHRTVVFSEEGVLFDNADYVLGTARMGHKQEFIPYHFLTVERGLGGVSVVKLLTGHFFLLPNKVIPDTRVKQLIEEGKIREQNNPREPRKEGTP